MTDVLIILALIALNGVFSMAELAIASAKRLRLEEAARNGSDGARVAIELADNPGTFLSTIQVGITLISIFNGAFGEASLSARLVPWVAQVSFLAPYSRQVSLGIVIVCLTLASIVFGELVPKSIALQHTERVAILLAKPIKRVLWLVKPLVVSLSFIIDLIVRRLGLQQTRDEAPTQQEISGMLKEGTDAGVLDKTEYDIVRRALRLDDQRLSALMTPRIDLQFIDLNDDLQRNLKVIAGSPHTRFPVWSTDRSHVLGVVHAGDLFEQAVSEHVLTGIDIAAAAKPPLYVPSTVTARGLLEQLRTHRTELALVLDEHGQLVGMVTLADLMGMLVGGVPGAEADEGDAIQREDGSWLMDGALSLERLRELLGTAAAFPEEAAGAYQTLAGFVLHQLGHIPQASEHMDWNGYRFEVVDMDRNRIDRVLVSRI